MKAKRFLLYTFVYIVATLSAVFGTLGVNALIKHGRADITQNGGTNQNTQIAEPSDGEKLLNGIMSLEKTKVNFTFDIFNNESAQAMSTSLTKTNAQNAITINFDGDLSINGLEDIKLVGNLLVNMPDNDISLSIAYLDSMLYLSTESMDIKFSTKSIAKIVEILPTLGLNLDLGFDISSIDTNELLTSFMTLKAVEQENGELLMPFTIMEGLSLDIFVDKDYVLKRVVANRINIGNITGALRANLTPDNTINISSPDGEKEFVDVTKTLNVIDSLKELITNKKAHFDVNASLSGEKQISFTGGMDIDLNGELNAYTDFTLDLNGTRHNLSVGYVGEDLYLTFNSIKLRLTKTDLISLVDTIKSQLGDVKLDESLLGVMATVLPNLDFKSILINGIKSIDINNLLQFAKGDDNVVKITILGKGLGIANNLSLSIKLDEFDQFESLAIEGVRIKGYTFDLTLAYRAQTIIPQLDKNEYAHLTNLDKFASAIITFAKQVLQDRQLTFELQTELEVQGIKAELEANVNVNFASTNNLHIYVDAKLKAFNKTFSVTISVDNGSIYLAIDNLVFTASISEIDSLKSALSGKFGNMLDVVDDLKDSFGLISDILDGKIETIPVNLINYITSGENLFSIGIDKALFATTDDLSITFGFDNSITDLTIGKVELLGNKISADIHILDEIVEKDFSQANLIPIANVDKFVSAVGASITEFMQGGIGFGINADIVVKGTNISVLGSAMIDNGIIYTEFVATAFDKSFDIEAYIIDKTVYITIDGLKLSLPIAKAIDLLKYQFDMDFDVDKFVRSLVPSFDVHSIIAGDLSSLSLEIIKDISFGETKTAITLNGEILAGDQDVIVEIDYATDIHSITVKNLSIFGTEINTELSLQSGVNIPTFINDYSDLSSTNEFINALKSTINRLKDAKQITLNLKLNATISGKAIGVAGKVYINATNIQTEFALDDLILYADVVATLEGKEIAIKARLENGFVYVEYGGLKIKIACNGIKELITTIQSITSINIDLGKFSDLISGSIVSELLAGDYSHLGLALIKKLFLTDDELSIIFAKELLGATSDININLGYSNRISTITIADLAVDDYQLALTANLDYYFRPEELIDDDYQDISGINKAINSLLNSVNKIKTDKEIAIAISNTTINLNGKTYRAYGNIYADFSKVQDLLDTESNVGIKALNGYIHLNLTSGVNDSHDITIFYKDKRIYLTYNSLNVCLGVEELDSIVDVIMQLKFLSESLKTQDISTISMKDLIAESKDKVLEQKTNVNVRDLILQLMPSIDLDAIKAGDYSSINLAWLKQLEITDNQAKVGLAKEMFNSNQDLSLTINYNDFISGIIIESCSLMGVDLSAQIELLDSFVAPKIFDESIYCNLDALQEVVDSTLNTAIEVVDNKHIAFGINTDIVHTALETDAKNNPTKAIVTTIHLLDGSNARFEWTDAYELVGDVNTLNIKKMRAYIHLEATTITEKFAYTNGVREMTPYSSATNNHSIEITFIDNVLYIRYNKMYAKIGGDSIDQLIRSVCDLLNIDLSEIDLAKLMEMLNGFNIEEMLSKFRVEMIEKLSITSSNIGLIMNIADLDLGLNTIDTLKLDVEYNTNSLTSLVVKDLNISNIQIDGVSIALQEFAPIAEAPNAEYIDLSGVENLIDALSNTIDYKDFQIDGTVNLKIDVIGINIDWNIPLSASAKIYDGGYEVYARLGTIPVITGVNNDAPFKTGNTGNSKNRILNIYIKDDFVYLHRTETIPAAITDRVYEKKVKVHIESLMSDPLYYILQYGLGLSDKIMEEIYKSLNIDRQNPIDYSNVLVGFTATSDSYSLTLNLKELTANDNLNTMSLGIKSTELNDKRVIDIISFEMDMPVANAVTILLATDGLRLSGLGSVIDMTHVDNYTADYSYKEGAFWDAYDGDWQLSSQRKFSLSFETNSSQKLNSIVGIAGSKVDIPTLDSYFTDDEIVRKTYTFAGWYTTATFDVGTEYIDNIMPRKDTTLYAKWSMQEEKYVTISFVTNGGSAIAPMKLLENTKLDLPTYLDLLTISTDERIITMQFDGWCVDEECTQMFDSATAPNFDITLYASWSVVESVEAHTVSVFDNGEKILTRRILSGNYIQLTGAKFKDSTKYYLDANYSTEISLNNFVMPENDVNIYIRNKYKFHIISQYGKVMDSEREIYQGERVNLIAQNSYDYDDGNEIERIDYIFNGYYNGENIIDDIENFVMPNEDLSINANWTIKVRQYVTISFKVDFVKPATWEADKKLGSKWFIRTECIQEATQPASFKVLEGTELVMSNYTSSCEYAYTGAFITKNYKFKLHTWSVEGPRQLSYNKLATQPDTEACDVLERFVVTEDTTFYAVWAYAG